MSIPWQTGTVVPWKNNHLPGTSKQPECCVPRSVDLIQTARWLRCPDRLIFGVHGIQSIGWSDVQRTTVRPVGGSRRNRVGLNGQGVLRRTAERTSAKRQREKSKKCEQKVST
jgi:hypothetical protein